MPNLIKKSWKVSREEHYVVACAPMFANILEKRAKNEIDNLSLLCPQILGPSAVPLGYLRSHYEQDFSHLQRCFELRLLDKYMIIHFDYII